MIRTVFLAAALLLAAPLLPSAVLPGTAATAKAAELKLQIRSTYPYRIYLEFYGQKWNHVWPGGGEVYVLKDSKYRTYNLWCRKGDTICYGAWVTTDESIYWGVGRGNTHGCRKCCFTCRDGRTDPITLSQ
jgi:hypothetical protein